jgi:Spy/CpxP family protein refolding chaperone
MGHSYCFWRNRSLFQSEEVAMRTNLLQMRASIIAVLAGLAVLAAGPLAAQDAAKSDTAKRTRRAQARTDSKPRGRLPMYYTGVVDDKQRDAIYKIQQEYEPQVAAAKSKLETVTKERDEKIAALLTAEQKQKIAEKQAAAKGKRGGDTKAGGDSPAPPTTSPPAAK